MRYFNPRPPCGGRLFNYFSCLFCRKISIHAPRAGGDIVPPIPQFHPRTISIHAPRAGGDCFRIIDGGFKRFQSTPPVRGATGDLVFRYRDKDISIHAPRAGGDKLSLLKT